MGYLSVWKVLEEMITDFRKRGIVVPTSVVGDLKYARTLINVLKADPSSPETSQRIEEYLCNVESYLISEGLEKFGNMYVEEWLKRLDEASKKVFDDEEEEVRFIPGIPREQRWIRIRPSEDVSIEALKALAEELNLSVNVQKDGCLLVYGEEELVKNFVKKMATKYGSKAGK
ncbi:MAG: DUF2096 family protein [Nitrososphaerota archaeon]|nr:DUF2096 family protein [Candidatus Bathyarchaeota archaeon]MDW8023594.1 DUF2096 family protein [Nitrososphaerota archaeon]